MKIKRITKNEKSAFKSLSLSEKELKHKAKKMLKLANKHPKKFMKKMKKILKKINCVEVELPNGGEAKMFKQKGRYTIKKVPE